MGTAIGGDGKNVVREITAGLIVNLLVDAQRGKDRVALRLILCKWCIGSSDAPVRNVDRIRTGSSCFDLGSFVKHGRSNVGAGVYGGSLWQASARWRAARSHVDNFEIPFGVIGSVVGYECVAGLTG
ncbi:MAG: hypothetical protein KDK08_00670 [Rhizobiaceae bacterium]|nr:hypothetical protein [Rhizobiaceae bacterium]